MRIIPIIPKAGLLTKGFIRYSKFWRLRRQILQLYLLQRLDAESLINCLSQDLHFDLTAKAQRDFAI